MTRAARLKPRATFIAFAIFAASCSDPVAPASPTPVEATTTETFTGTLALAGSNVHTFSVSQVGRLRVTLTSLSSAGVTVLLAVGTPTGPVCVPADSKAVQSAAAPQLTGTATITGTFCISVSDSPATLTAPVDYSVSVTHS